MPNYKIKPMTDNVEIDNAEIIEKASHSDLFRINIDRFIEEITALNETLPMELAILSIKHQQLIEQLEKISTSVEESDSNGKEIVKYKAKIENIEEFSEIHKHLRRADIAHKILPRNFIVSIVSQYDAFLGELTKILYDINPNIIRSCEKGFNIEDLFSFESIDDLKEHLIDKEVESLLREEHYEQLKVLERRISKVLGNGFTLTTDLPVLPSFVELTQRRNLFVHSNGMVSRQYIDAQKKWNFESNCKGETNEELIAEPEYCEKAFHILYELSVKLTHVLWRKFAPIERELADEHLNEVIYNLLIDNEYDLAIELCNFGTNVIKKFFSEQIRKIIIINKAIAYKMLEKPKECKKVIDNEDWSIGNEFKLAKLVLEDDFDGAKTLMLKIGPKDDMINKKAYENWPLFKKFRKTEEFKSSYLALFEEEFSVEEIQDKSQIIKDNKTEE